MNHLVERYEIVKDKYINELKVQLVSLKVLVEQK